MCLLIGCGAPLPPASTLPPIASRAPTEAATSTLASSPTVRPTLKPTQAPTRRRLGLPAHGDQLSHLQPEPEPIAIGPFQPCSIPDQPPGKIIDLRVAPDGTLWIVTDESVGSLRDGQWTLHPEVKGTLAGFDAAGRTWLISEKGDRILAWDGADWTAYGEEAGWVEADPFSQFREGVATDKRGWVWLTAGQECARF